MNKHSVLAVVAHPDDEIIGVGGTLCKLAKNGSDVHVLILSEGRTSRDDVTDKNRDAVLENALKESEAALDVLGVKNVTRLQLPDNQFDTVPLLSIAKEVSKVVAQIQPSIVLTHHFGDLNIDHQIVFQATVTACRPSESFVEKILLFETLSSSEMAGPVIKDVFMPNYFINIEHELQSKLDAMSKYAPELREFPHPRSLKAIEYNAIVWGSKVNMGAVEPFELFR